MKDTARKVIRDLTNEIIDHGDIPANWELIDRIERRFRLAGYADSLIESHKSNLVAFRLAKAKEAWGKENSFHIMPSPY